MRSTASLIERPELGVISCRMSASACLVERELGHDRIPGHTRTQSTMTVRTPLPVLGLLGPTGTLVVRGHAMVEGP